MAGGGAVDSPGGGRSGSVGVEFGVIAWTSEKREDVSGSCQLEWWWHGWLPAWDSAALTAESDAAGIVCHDHQREELPRSS